MDFSQIELPDHPSIRAIFDLVPHSPRHSQKTAIDPVDGIPQLLHRLFPETDADFLAAIFLDDLKLTPIFCERDYYGYVIPAPVLDHLDALREVALTGLRDGSPLHLRRYMMLRHTKTLEHENVRTLQEDFFKTAHILSLRERDIDRIVGMTGNEPAELRLVDAFVTAHDGLSLLEKSVPERLTYFSRSGLQMSPPVQSAFRVMIDMNAADMGNNVTEICLHQLDFALDVQNNWRDDPALIAAALLHGPYRSKFMAREWPGKPEGVDGDVCEFLKEKFDRRGRKGKTAASADLRILDTAEAVRQLEKSNARVKDVSDDQLREIILTGDGYSFFEGQVLYWNDDDRGAASLVESFLADPHLLGLAKAETLARVRGAVATKRDFLDRCTELQALHQPRLDSESSHPAFI